LRGCGKGVLGLDGVCGEFGGWFEGEKRGVSAGVWEWVWGSSIFILVLNALAEKKQS